MLDNNNNSNTNTNSNSDSPNNNGWVFSENQANNNEEQANSSSSSNPQNSERETYSSSFTKPSGYNSKFSYSSYHEATQNAQPNNSQNNFNSSSNSSSSSSSNASFPKESESYQWNYEDYQSHQQAPSAPKHKRNKGLKVFAMIMCGILCAGVMTLAGFGVVSIVSAPEATASTEEPVEEKADDLLLSLTDKPKGATEQLADGQLTITERAYKVQPSVVGIVAYQDSQNIFTAKQGQGSGIIASQDGYIITNAHVVNGATNLKVVLHDETEYNATLVGLDTKTDLAVIKVDAKGLTPAEFGNSDQLQVGEQVITVGNPGGLELAGSVTVGYVSALNRPITTGQGTSINCIQTDAAINPGNSGGALVNPYGQVIGINSQKIAATEYEGIGFAISINEAQPIVNDLIAHGYVTGRVRLGITAVQIDAYSAQVYGYQPGIGVTAVEAGTPAATAGLVAGDVITKIDGTEITTFEELNTILAKHKVGDTVSLTVFRKSVQNMQNDKTLNIKIALIEAGKEAPAVAQSGAAPSQGQQQIPNLPIQ